MLDNLTTRLAKVVKTLRGQARLTDENIGLCEQYLKGSYDLQVLDIYRHPEKLREDQIVAVPALVKRLPAPLRLLVGDLSRPEQVLSGLGLTARAH